MEFTNPEKWFSVLRSEIRSDRAFASCHLFHAQRNVGEGKIMRGKISKIRQKMKTFSEPNLKQIGEIWKELETTKK
jgi:hypothetical protein